MSDSTGSSKANLARIRDNQRRSRARRKEYLQELEAKYRACEQLGVEASAEMQAAARKVLEENRRLRALLKSRGMLDADIDAFMVAEAEGGEDAMTLPSEDLKTILGSRKPCCPGNTNCGPSPMSMQPGNSILKQERPQPGPTLSTHIAPLPQSNIAISPQSGLTSSTPTPTSLQTQMTFQTTLGTHPESTGHSPQPVSNYPYATSYEPQWPPHEATRDMDQRLEYGNTSCVEAASIIRSMSTHAGPELEADLGCQPGSDCAVQNLVVFDVMEKYTTPSNGMWR